MKPDVDLTALNAGYPDQRWLTGELRSDHAGETGAVWIYKGVLAVGRDPALLSFCREHLETEKEHLALMNQLLPANEQSWLLPIWRVAGFLTGLLPALIGPRHVYLMVSAVETFVESHYRKQIIRLKAEGDDALADLLASCMADEVHHQQEAQLRVGTPERGDRFIRGLIGSGSALAVMAARKI